jgi:hypothetical protein
VKEDEVMESLRKYDASAFLAGTFLGFVAGAVLIVVLYSV